MVPVNLLHVLRGPFKRLGPHRATHGGFRPGGAVTGPSRAGEDTIWVRIKPDEQLIQRGSDGQMHVWSQEDAGNGMRRWVHSCCQDDTDGSDSAPKRKTPGQVDTSETLPGDPR